MFLINFKSQKNYFPLLKDTISHISHLMYTFNINTHLEFLVFTVSFGTNYSTLLSLY